MILGGHTQLVVKGAVLDLHIVPVHDDVVLNGVLEGQDTVLSLGLIPCDLLPHARHEALVLGASTDGWEHGPGHYPQQPTLHMQSHYR